MSEIMYFVVGILAIVLIGKILMFPLKLIWKLVVNGVIGCVALIIINWLSPYTGIFIEITPLRAVVAGLLGLPGIIILSILS